MSLAVTAARRSAPQVWTPRKLSSVAAWWHAGDISAADGASVASWTDRIQGLAAAQATGSQQPTYVAAGANGKPALAFAKASNQKLTKTGGVGTLNTTAPYTVVVIASSASVVGGKYSQAFELSSATTNGYRLGTLSQAIWFHEQQTGAEWAGQYTVSTDNSTPFVCCYTVTAGGHVVIQRDNNYSAQDLGTGTMPSGSPTALTIGGSSQFSGASDLPWDGRIYDVIVTKADMSAADRTVLQLWANARYGCHAGNSYNASSPSTTPTPDGSNTTIEHTILDFGGGGFGSPTAYRYVAAMVAYPNNDNTLENPSIYGSADGLTWSTFNGVSNPVQPYPTGVGGSNADPRLFDNRARDGKFYLYFSIWQASLGANEGLWCRSSSDLVTWSAASQILNVTPSAIQAQEANVVWDGTQYVLLTTHSTMGQPRSATYYERRTSSSPTGSWSAPTTLFTAADCPSGNSIWHVGDIIKVGSKWITGMSDNTAASGSTWAVTPPGMRGWMISSPDLITWTFGRRPIYVPAALNTSWDYPAGCYRLSFTDTGSGLQMWYTTNPGNALGNRLGKGGIVPYSEIP